MIELPHGGLAMGVQDDVRAVELGSMLQTAYLNRIRQAYRQRAGLQELAAQRQADTEDLFFAAAAAHMKDLFDDARASEAAHAFLKAAGYE